MATNPLHSDPHVHARIPRGRRAHSRARVALPAELETIEGMKQVKLRNLSSAGAMVEGAQGPGIGRDLVLKCFGIDSLGVVVWEDDRRFGIEFYDQIDDDEVVRQRQLSDDHVEQQKWRSRDELLRAAERWSVGKS